MSAQTLQPLIWLARNSTRLSVFDDTPPFSAATLRAFRARMASGMIITGFFIRACMIALLLVLGFHNDDGWRRRNVTEEHESGTCPVRAAVTTGGARSST